jgi:DNA helicase-2/ATP-dependent DNA helicase PcrA
VARVYEVYERALREHNIMDFNGMILDACRLAHKIPAVAARIRQSYPYWLIDEFQDTTPAQYRLIRFLAGDDFKNVFAVADDDQIIYQWAGASYRQLTLFQQHFAPALIQLVENHRCPPEIVDAANNLISHNAQRTPGKDRLVSTLPAKGPAIRLRTSGTDSDEAEALAEELANAPAKLWGETAVLGRTRAILQPFLHALRKRSVAASIATRRDRFVSPQFVWLQACLDQALRPTDKQVFKGMAGAANRISGMELDAAILAAEADSSGKTYLEHWATVAGHSDNAVLCRLGEFGSSLVRSRAGWQKTMSAALAWLPTTVDVPDDVVSDVEEDKAAWEVAMRAIRAEKGGPPDLDELLQGIALRPKEPPVNPESVRLLTIHSAKGLQFRFVWLVGLVESILPAWQSLKPEASPAEMEEERRNCFVAITRTQEQLTLSYAHTYRGWAHPASRFIAEMQIADTPPANL